MLGTIAFAAPGLFGFTLGAVSWNAWMVGAVVVAALWALPGRTDTRQQATG